MSKNDNDFSLPDWIPLGAWNAFLEMRKKKNNPLSSERMINRQINRLSGFRSSGYNIEEILDASTNAKWDDTWPLKDARTQVSSAYPGETSSQFQSRKSSENKPITMGSKEDISGRSKMPEGLAEQLRSMVRSKIVR